jgi:hypothetical protein
VANKRGNRMQMQWCSAGGVGKRWQYQIVLCFGGGVGGGRKAVVDRRLRCRPAVTSAARNWEVGTVHCERSRRMKGLDRSTGLAERLVEGIEVR